MSQDWTLALPSVAIFLIGLGGLAGAMLAMLKLWQAVVPDMDTLMRTDIAEIHADLQDIRAKVSELEREIARIDQPAIVRRFDGIESKIDRLYDLIIERIVKA